jgi:HlyD family secretion protein
MKRTFIIILVVAGLAVVGFFGMQWLRQSQSASAAAQFITETVQRGNLSASVGGTGTVRANQSAVLAWQTSGSIETLDAQVGDIVKADQELALLKESSLSQSLILARSDLISAKKNLDDLLNSDVARATAYQALVAAEKELTDANTKRLSKQYTRGSQSTIELNQADLLLAQLEYDAAVEHYDLFKNRDDMDEMKASALSRLSAARKALDRAKANLQYVTTMPNDNEVAQADARIQVAEARLKEAQREWERIKDGPNADDITAAETRIKAIEATLNLIHLVAPFQGTITERRGMPGDQVSPGTVTYRLDDLSRLLVDVQITEVDINRISLDQVVDLSFDAIPDTAYQGKVVEVGRVGNSIQGVVNFTITIEVSNPDDLVRPGMTAAVNIITENVSDVLLVPNRAVRVRGGERVVYVLKDGTPAMTPIVLGLSGDTMSEVLEGVKEGDILVLNPPVEFQPGGPPGGGMGMGN